MIKAGFVDDLITMLRAGFLTANYSPQAPVLHSNVANGIKEHFFTVIKMCGDQHRPNMRNPEILERDMLRVTEDKTAAKRQFKTLAKLISFKDVPDNGVPQLGQKDVSNAEIAREAARQSLLAKGIPEDEIRFTYLDVMPIADNKFMIATDIDFPKLARFVPEPERKEFNQNILFLAIADARFDIGAAAAQNAAFIGNERNETITSILLSRSLGARFDPSKVQRQLYDFVSVAVPSVREVINKGERGAIEFVALMEKATAFKEWLRKQNPTADLVTEMMREKGRSDWLQSLPVKGMRFGIFTGLGMLADAISPGVSVLTGAADSFLVDKIAKHWRPHYFVENNLRGFLEQD